MPVLQIQLEERELSKKNWRRQKGLLALAAILLGSGILALLAWLPGTAAAAPTALAEKTSAQSMLSPPAAPAQQIVADEACRLCHGSSDREITFPSNETLPIQIDLQTLSASAHGDQPGAELACTGCHAPANYQFPHKKVEASNLREYAIARSASCEHCHVQPHITSHPGTDSENPVVCTDCHGSHTVLTNDQLLAGEGSAACVDCHAERDIPLTDPFVATQVIRDGLFTMKVDQDYCLACHSQSGLTMTLDNGDVLPLTIDREAFHDSVHGIDNPWQPLDCVDCHDRYVYPHEPVQVASKRDYNLQNYTKCAECHERNYERALDSVHGEALEKGNENAAVCTDCHGAHDTPTPNEPRERISQTCRKCHSSIYDKYAQSVHGAALLADSNPDVATCIDCHGVHNIADPTTALARARSPELCARCHADEKLMAKYGISTDVFETYVTDFHGTTATLFERRDPNVEINTAVCYDCHGVHDIRPVDDPNNGIKVNLVETCRKCHPDAKPNFSDAWTSHYQPSLQHNPLVFLVNTFYAFVIPMTIGGFAFLVATDVFRRVRLRWKKRK
jgi:predicted CXXCH cytochrome family protein